MKILVVGGGGREHAIIKKLKADRRELEIFAAPGNGGIAKDAVCVDIGAKNITALVSFATEKGIDYAVVAPDDPLVLGAVDALEEAGVRCFGPRKSAAIIEGSKVFAKELMRKYGIPTAAYRVFGEADEALRYIKAAPLPTVIKADGLALGKGVIIAKDRGEAEAAVRSIMEEGAFGESGKTIVVEEFLEGAEVSVLSFTDGDTIIPMISSMDHKRAKDGNLGLNTGGMGTVAPNPYYDSEAAKLCMEHIFKPTIEAMKAEGRPFKGCLYFGLMLTDKGPKVIEYNCRFGDPETQVVLPLLESDLLDIMEATTDGTLSQCEVRFSDKSACCVVLASEGYPEKYNTGYEVRVPMEYEENVYMAGVKSAGGRQVTSGGRVLGAVAVADSLAEAVDEAYKMAENIDFENKYYRRDIGRTALDKPEHAGEK